MSQRSFSPGFRGRRKQSDLSARLPPGQYLEQGLPVLSAGPTPHTPLTAWDFSILEGSDQRKRWTWDEFRGLPHETVTADIHCVTKWSKLDTNWEGVSVDTLLAQIDHHAKYVMAFCDGGYTTNLPMDDVMGGKAWVAYRDELARLLEGGTQLQVSYTLTRTQPPGWTGYRRRIDADLLREVVWLPDEHPLVFVCGPTPFVESAAGNLVALGYEPERIKTERFGPTGEA